MRNASLAIAFVLGACTTAAIQSAAHAPNVGAEAGARPAPEGPAATVTELERAEVRTAPSGKARVALLARGENAFLGRLELEGGGGVPEHRDATEEYVHVLEGGGTITIDGHAHQLRAGSTVYMPANATVSFQNGPEPMVALQVFAGPEPAAKYDAWTGS